MLLAAVTNLRGPFGRAVIKISIKVEYAEVPLSSVSLIVHPVHSQFVKEHTMYQVFDLVSWLHTCFHFLVMLLSYQISHII